MSQNLKKNFALLKALQTTSARQRRAIISTADKSLIGALVEIVNNVLQGTVVISASDKKKLRGYKTLLRNLVRKGSLTNKKKAIIQRGGFLPALLGPVLGVIASLIGSAI